MHPCWRKWPRGQSLSVSSAVILCWWCLHSWGLISFFPISVNATLGCVGLVVPRLASIRPGGTKNEVVDSFLRDVGKNSGRHPALFACHEARIHVWELAQVLFITMPLYWQGGVHLNETGNAKLMANLTGHFQTLLWPTNGPFQGKQMVVSSARDAVDKPFVPPQQKWFLWLSMKLLGSDLIGLAI